MSKLVCFLFFIFLLVSCKDKSAFQQSQEKESEYKYDQLPDSLKPQIEFSQYSHDFGKFSNEVQKKVVFTFENEGKAPLILHNVHGNCGCVTVQFSKNPIMPGRKGKIVIKYDGRGYEKGKFVKEIVVNSNSVTRYFNLQIKGETY